METPKEILEKERKKFINDIVPAHGDREFKFDVGTISQSSRPEFGDYTETAAIKIAFQTKKESGAVAQQIKDGFERSAAFAGLVESTIIVKPGFINFTLKDSWLLEQLPKILNAGERYGSSERKKGAKIQVEFISANPTGPLTLANGRGGVLGDTLANVLTFAGAHVEREYYINDAGRQIRLLGESVLTHSGIVAPHEEHYKGDYIEDLARKFSRELPEYKDKPEDLGRLLASELLEREIKPSIAALGINFSRWYSEYKEVHKPGKIQKLLKELQEQKLTYPKDGALWLATTNAGDDKDRVLVTREGEPTYFAADILHHKAAYERGFWRINIVGADHHGYVGRIQAATTLLKYQGRLRMIVTQLVRLVRGGEEVRMSKRRGVYVALDELLDEVGMDAVRFFFLARSPEVHMDFDLDLAKEQSQVNPVYRVQYAHARISSIVKKADLSKFRNVNVSKYQLEPAERALLVELIHFPELVQEIVQTYTVHQLPIYALKLADRFHQFYEKHRVLEEGEVNPFRLELIKATQIVLKNLLGLMGISAPTSM